MAVIALSICGWSFAAPGEDLLRASALLSGGDLDGAVRAFEQAAQADNSCAVAFAGKGAGLLFSGRENEARAAFNDALALDPGLPCAHIGAGTVCCRMGDYHSAAQHYHSALVNGPRRPALALAGEAYAACGLGLYETAMQQAQAALGTDPDHPVARFALAAAELACGYPRGAADLGASTPRRRRGVVAPIFLRSCLLSPGTSYWQAHALEDQARLAQFGLGAGPSVASEPWARQVAPSTDFELSRPAPGAEVDGAMVVDVAASESVAIDYVIVHVNDSFAGITSARPFKAVVDTRLFGEGLADVRVDGYDSLGACVRTADAKIRIRNGSRTLDPREQDARRAVAELLEDLLLPPISPTSVKQLAAHGMLRMNRPADAAGILESAYACDPQTPGLRSDLQLAYTALGLQLRDEAPEVYTLPDNGKKVAITFDDGPHPLITPWILDQLDKERVQATFFLVGKQATLYPELVREIRRRGHQIGSHSYAHYSLRELSPSECEQDLVKSRLAIREACGETVSLFRPPGGYYDSVVKRAAGNLGFSTVFWTANITSFPGRDGKRIAVELARQCADGGIILLHNGEDETLDTLPYLIPELRKHGVRFVTVSADASSIVSTTPQVGSGR